MLQIILNIALIIDTLPSLMFNLALVKCNKGLYIIYARGGYEEMGVSLFYTYKLVAKHSTVKHFYTSLVISSPPPTWL